MMGSEMLRRQCYGMVLLVLMASVLWSPVSLAESTTTGEQCPQECSCDVDATIRCSGVAGLRGMDKSQPIARLVLSGLELTKIPASLENMRNITELDLSANRLSEVNHLGKRVRKLNLSHNRITSGKLARIPPFVESLNLTHNEITHLPLHLMKLKKLRYIELANNPINCTCETLHIRNWLTSRHVWSDEHIKCMAPAEFKGRPWLQVRQSDVCHPSVVEERKGGYNWDDYEDDNELMLGDQPHHAAANEDDDQEDDLHSDFLPVNREKVKRQEPLIVEDNNEEEEGDEASGNGPALGEPSISVEARAKVFDNLVAADDGSGDDSPSLRTHTEKQPEEKSAGEDEDSTDDGSGSGGGLLPSFIGAVETGSLDITSETIPVDDGLEDVKKDEEEESPLGYPTVNGNLGIFVDETSSPTSATTEETATERQNERVMLGGAMGGVKVGDAEGGAPVIADESERTAATQSEEDNRNTYILLAILGIIVVSLIVMVVCKRKPDSRNRRGKYDVETANQGRELKEMNKNLLEKTPGDRNGHGVAGGGAPEQAPLMGKSDYDKVFGDPKKTAFTPVKPQRTSLEKPMESFKPIPAERTGGRGPESDNNNTTTLPNGNGALHNGGEQVHKPPVVPDATDSDGHLLAEPPMESPRSKRYSPIYVPTSPKSDRYSPVYSPETGRVKIKLTETPKPKTPILVTRSRSRAGEIITTMDDQKF